MTTAQKIDHLKETMDAHKALGYHCKFSTLGVLVISCVPDEHAQNLTLGLGSPDGQEGRPSGQGSQRSPDLRTSQEGECSQS